jgi:hypothetical protein
MPRRYKYIIVFGDIKKLRRSGIKENEVRKTNGRKIHITFLHDLKGMLIILRKVSLAIALNWDYTS